MGMRDADAVYRRHQLDPTRAAALDAAWREKLTDDAELRLRFKDLIARYSSWLRANAIPS
ncbi:MAG: hypothetical protein AAGA56_10305 [Myxococcota bacterium]